MNAELLSLVNDRLRPLYIDLSGSPSKPPHVEPVGYKFSFEREIKIKCNDNIPTTLEAHRMVMDLLNQKKKRDEK